MAEAQNKSAGFSGVLAYVVAAAMIAYAVGLSVMVALDVMRTSEILAVVAEAP